MFSESESRSSFNTSFPEKVGFTRKNWRSFRMKKETAKIKIDRSSFQLGMINCFVEMVACGVKNLAISPPVSPKDYFSIREASEKIVRSFGIKSYLEKSLLLTDLQTADFTEGKWSILYYEDEAVLRKYMDLKALKDRLEKEKKYDERERKNISREFMKLLSYPEEKIEEKLSKAPGSPFLIADEKGRA
jgi:hypothetical protein